jgi:ATP adenylyltransferase
VFVNINHHGKENQQKLMEIRFTPWRMQYIKRTDEPEGETGCVLCHIHQCETDKDAENLLLYRGDRCYVVMNLYPYNGGHLMVVPYTHTADLVHLEPDTAQELFTLTRRCVGHLTEAFHPHGFNLGMNLGRTAGAGIDQHLHMHIVPRWNGDTNFLPLIGGTKLIPEALADTYARLHPLFHPAPAEG